MKVLNDVLGYNLKIYQDRNWFCFSIDSIILANFPKIKFRTKRILDLGCGNGIVALIMALRTNTKIDAVEIQKDMADMAQESVIYNNLSDKISIINMDIKNYVKNFSLHNTYDLIVSNPPYFKINNSSIKNIDIHKAIARHEVFITITDIIECSFQLLRDGGTLAMVNRIDRFIEIIDIMKKNRIEPKYIRFIYDNLNIKPSLFYIEGEKNGRSGLEIDIPFIMYNGQEKTEEYSKIYNEVM